MSDLVSPFDVMPHIPTGFKLGEFADYDRSLSLLARHTSKIHLG